MKRVMLVTGIVLVVAFFAGFVLASTNPSATGFLDSNYSYGGNITGTLKMNFSDLPYNATLIGIAGTNETSISLMDFINLQKNFARGTNYACYPYDCNPSYSATGTASSTVNLRVNQGESKVIGLIITGKVSNGGISGFSLSATSDATQNSNQQPLKVIPLNNSNLKWTSEKPSGQYGSTRYVGGYESAYNLPTPANIGSGIYCERVQLTVSPLVEIGISNLSGSGSSNLTLSLQDSSRHKIGECQIPSGDYNQDFKECLAQNNGNNVTIPQTGYYFVCITGSDTDHYTMPKETTAPIYGDYKESGSYTVDTPLFAVLGTFAPAGNFTINGTTVSSVNDYINTYIKNKYNYDCTNSCVIPIIFNSNQDQNLTISASATVDTSNLGSYTSQSISTVSISNSTRVSTIGFQNFSLDKANFSSGDFGSHNFILKLFNGTDNVTLLRQKINVQKIPKIAFIKPTVAIAAIPQKFSASVNTYGSSANITSYTWNFGDGSTAATTKTNFTTHTYANTGTYPVNVSVKNSDGLSSTSSFAVSVKTPKDAVNSLLGADYSSLKSIQTTLGSGYSTFAQAVLTKALNLDKVIIQLNGLKKENASASTDQDYVNIMNNLTAISLPDSIYNTISATQVFLAPSADNVNLDALKAAGGGTYNSSREKDYKNYVVSWELSNATTLVDYKEFSGLYGENLNPLLNIVKITVQANPSRVGTSYLMIPALNDIQLDKNYTQESGYYYVPLSSSSQTVELATTQSLDLNALPFFVAPSLSQISLPVEETNSSDTRWITLTFIILGIVAFGFVIYVILGKWYQKRYESYLFKNKNDLYNIVTYIHSAKSKGVKNSEIEKNLRKSSWNSEQISYIMKRYAGKQVGLLGFRIRGDRKPKKNPQQPGKFPGGMNPQGPGFRPMK